MADPSRTRAGTVTSANFHHSVRAVASAILHRSQQEFDIAFGAGNRAFGDSEHGPALRSDPFGRVLTNALVDQWVTNHPALADFFALGFELRLDQRHQLRARLGEPQRGAEHLRQADKARFA